jgi:hypothetical protein
MGALAKFGSQSLSKVAKVQKQEVTSMSSDSNTKLRSGSIFKAVVTHFESGQTRLNFGNAFYEIFPGYQGRVSYFEGKGKNDPYSTAHHMSFDEACEVVALSIESEIMAHWGRERV